MSTPSNNDPRHEIASQTDDAVLSQHSSESSGSRGLGSVFSVVFAFLLCFAGIYLERSAGRYDGHAYNEDAADYPAAPAGPKSVDMVALGLKQYNAACVTCHQSTGLGQPGTYPPLAGSEWVNGSEERAIRIVLHGLTGPITVAGQEYSGSVQMPSFGKFAGSSYNWRDDQVAAVLTYVRQAWGNTGAAVTPEKVAEIRNKENRTTPWTVAELEKIP